MARQSLQKVYADFRLGWVDVASELQQPQGSVRDIENFDIDIDGALIKRAGLSEVGTASNFNFDITTNRKPSFHIWKNVANDINKQFLMVVVDNNRYRFFDISDGVIDLSSSSQIHTTTISASSSITSDSFSKVKAVSAIGRLFVTNSSHEPVVFSYNENTGNIGFEKLNIQIRDTELWRGPTDDDTGINRTTSTEIEVWHEYNLRNSGWPLRVVASISANADDGVFFGVNPFVYTRRIIGEYPNIAIPFSSARAGSGNRTEEQNAFNPWVIQNDYFGNTVPPVGKFVKNINPFIRTGSSYIDQGSGGTHVQTGTNTETARLTEYPSSVAFYSGRLWYGSNGTYDTVTTTTGYPPSSYLGGSKIYFSQAIQDDFTKASKCYQENDPTAEDINQLLATDGGVISIKETGDIKALVPLGTSLLVLAENGIWRIAGRDFNSFTADSFTVDKISDAGVESSDSFVATKNRVYTLTSEGLFVTGKVDSFSDISYQDISSAKIKKFFYNLSELSLSTAILRYDDKRNLLFCFLNIPQEGEVFSDTEYNTALIYNEDLDCFYKYTLDLPSSHKLSDVLLGLDAAAETEFEAVTDSSLVNVTDSNGDIVTVSTGITFRYIDSSLTLMLSKNGSNAVAATFSDSTNFQDLGNDYTAKVEIGFDSIGSLIADRKQAPFVLSYLRRVVQTFAEVLEGAEVIGYKPEPDVSCKLRYKWDWATNETSDQELYRLLRLFVPSSESELAYGEDVIKNKSRVRGRGTALSIILESPEQTDAQILGLGVQYVGEGN